MIFSDALVKQLEMCSISDRGHVKSFEKVLDASAEQLKNASLLGNRLSIKDSRSIERFAQKMFSFVASADASLASDLAQRGKSILFPPLFGF